MTDEQKKLWDERMAGRKKDVHEYCMKGTPFDDMKLYAYMQGPKLVFDLWSIAPEMTMQEAKDILSDGQEDLIWTVISSSFENDGIKTM